MALLALPLAAGCDEGPPATNEKVMQVRRIQELAEEDSPEAVRQIAAVAADEDSDMARKAVWALARCQHPESREALAGVVARDARPPVRREAVSVLAQLPREQVRPEGLTVLRRAARSDPDASVRGEAAAALGVVGGLEDVRLLVEVAVKTEDLAVQARAVRAIEDLIDVRFRYDAKAPPGERAKALARIEAMAPAIAEMYMKYHPGKR
jgi:HEAT repeat protein